MLCLMRSFSGETANEGASYSHTPIKTASSLPQKISGKGRGGRRRGQPCQSRWPCMETLGPSSTPGPGTAIAQRCSGQPSQGWVCVQFHASSGAMPTLSFWMEPDSPIKMHRGRDFPNSPVVKTQPPAEGRGLILGQGPKIPHPRQPKTKT